MELISELHPHIGNGPGLLHVFVMVYTVECKTDVQHVMITTTQHDHAALTFLAVC